MAQGVLVDAPVPPIGELNPLTDLELTAAINNGDATAFEVLYRP